jgi:uridine phosphorylase
MGFTAKANIIVNCIVPYLFAYGQFMGEDKYVDRAMDFMTKLKPESNKIIKRWKEHNIQVKNAMDTQALIHLYKEYCLKKRCTECAFGNKILKSISMLIKEDMENTYRALLI